MSMFIPEVYASTVLTNIENALVATSLTNSNYTGEISQSGDTVHVYAVGDLQVRDHVRGQAITFQKPSGAEKTLVIDQEKDCSFLIDDVDSFQSAVNVRNAYAERQGRAMAEDVDSFVLNKYAAAGEQIATTATTASGFISVVRKAKVALSDQGVPRDGRYLVLPPFYASLISEYMTETLQDAASARSGFVGRVEGFDVFESNRLAQDDSGTASDATDDKIHAMAGHSEAITLARQIINVDFVPSHPSYHAAAWKGLLVYGAKVFIPKALVDLSLDVPA